MYCALKDILRNETIYVDITETDNYGWSGTLINSPLETFFTFARYYIQYELDKDEWEELKIRQYKLEQDEWKRIGALLQKALLQNGS